MITDIYDFDYSIFKKVGNVKKKKVQEIRKTIKIWFALLISKQAV